MESSRSSVVLTDKIDNKQAVMSSQSQQLARKKRKAEEDFTEDKETKNTVMTSIDTATIPKEIKENATPPAPELKPQERTPGRVGPIKRDNFSLKPDIQPFKGPPGKKVRKTRAEKAEEYRQFIRENEDHPFHELYVCFDKGPNGSPTYDKSGFELSYEKVADWMKPKAYNKRSMVRGMDRAIAKQEQEEQRMKEIFFEKGEAPERAEVWSMNAWKDRVSKDLDVPWHKVGIAEFEEWGRRGFKKARKGEYETFSAEETQRFMRLLSGASLRK